VAFRPWVFSLGAARQRRHKLPLKSAGANRRDT
jgi:hypothetical protein